MITLQKQVSWLAVQGIYEWLHPSENKGCVESSNFSWTVLVVSKTIDHDRQQCTSGQFLFYHIKEAINFDKPSDGEPPCWNVAISNAVVLINTSTVCIFYWKYFIDSGPSIKHIQDMSFNHDTVALLISLKNIKSHQHIDTDDANSTLYIYNSCHLCHRQITCRAWFIFILTFCQAITDKRKLFLQINETLFPTEIKEWVIDKLIAFCGRNYSLMP